MFVTSLRVAWRNILKNGLYSAVNVIGLFAGILFFLLVGAHVWSEMQINRTLRNADRQYFLTSIWKDPNLGMEITAPAPLGKRLREQYPQLVADYYRWDGITSGISKGDKHFREGIQIGDSTMLRMFGFELLHGDPARAMSEPYTVVLTESKARKIFGKTDVVGETLGVQSFDGNKREFRVTGVLRELPENSVTHLLGGDPNGIFVPLGTAAYFGRSDMDLWPNIIIPTYIELQAGVEAADLEEPLRQLIAREGADFEKANLSIRPVAMTDYYLGQNGGSVRRMLYALASVGLFILFMAVVNFVNLSVGRSGARIREIGVRKTLGGLKHQLIVQFLTESIVLSAVATLLACVAYPLARPFFAQIIGKDLPALTGFPVAFALAPPVLAAAVGLLAGAYPAFFLASMKTVDSLKGKLRSAGENIALRKYLVGFQFSVALFVIVAALVVANQVNHFFEKNLGYDREFVVSAQVPRDWTPAGVRRMLTVRNEFARMPEVREVCLSFEIPNGNNGGQPPLYRAGADSTTAIVCQQLTTDEKYLDTYRIALLAGAYFDSRGLDSGKVVLNERAALALGFERPETAVGQPLRVSGSPEIFTVKGVVKDFHFGSMQAQIQPMVLYSVYGNPVFRYLSFKIRPEHVGESMAALQRKWSELLPGSAFEYTFMDDVLAKLYTRELQLKKAAYMATALALLIALLGVLGLVSLSLRRRLKEIGVRKVLGASGAGIVGLFLKEFMLVLLLAGLLVCPLAWYLLDKWLNAYAYRIALTPAVFAAALAGMALLTALLIGLQSARAASSNPVDTLRSE